MICKIFGVKIITRSNTSPEGWSNNEFKKFLYKKIIKKADKVMVNSRDFQKEFKKVSMSFYDDNFLRAVVKLETVLPSKIELYFLTAI